MRLVVADSGPINYLALIGHLDVLPALFGKLILPAAVQMELNALGAPRPVRAWIANPPSCVEVRKTSSDLDGDPLLQRIHEGERAAIILADALHADLLLMDDRKGVRAARMRGLNVTGTLGILELATRKGLVDFAGAVDLLQQTNFRSPNELIAALRAKYRLYRQ